MGWVCLLVYRPPTALALVGLMVDMGTPGLSTGNGLNRGKGSGDLFPCCLTLEGLSRQAPPPLGRLSRDSKRQTEFYWRHPAGRQLTV